MQLALIGVVLIALGCASGYVGADKVDDSRHPVLAHLFGWPSLLCMFMGAVPILGSILSPLVGLH